MEDKSRNLLLLVAGWTLWVTGDSSQISIAALAGKQLAPDWSWSTIPMATQFIGAALASIPAALIMGRLGRRAGFMCGSILAMLGSGLSYYALTTNSLTLYMIGTLCIGMFIAFVQLYRFAAAELAPVELKGKFISYVLAGGAIGGLLGPNLQVWLQSSFADPAHAGMAHAGMAGMEGMAGMSGILGYRSAYLVYGLVGVLTLAVMSRLSMDAPPPPPEPKDVRSLGQIARQPNFVVGALSAIGSFAIMALFMAGMTMMMEDPSMGHSHHMSTLAMSGHYFAMYLPALFVGVLAGRFGANRIVIMGGALYLVAFLLAMLGDMRAMVPMWTFMILLGAGWSFMFIGGTALVTRSYKPHERPRAQGLHDFLLFSTVALAAYGSGSLFHAKSIGWDNMALIALVATAVIIVANVWHQKAGPRPA
jgi:MFS family permease